MSTILDKITDAWARAWGEGDTSAFENLVDENYLRHSKTGEERLPEVITQIIESHQAFSELRMEVCTAIEDDNLVAIHWRSSGKHTGDFMGVPPTGRSVTVDGASFIGHKNGRITRETVVWDPREMLSSISIFHLGDQRLKKNRSARAAQ